MLKKSLYVILNPSQSVSLTMLWNRYERHSHIIIFYTEGAGVYGIQSTKDFLETQNELGGAP